MDDNTSLSEVKLPNLSRPRTDTVEKRKNAVRRVDKDVSWVKQRIKIKRVNGTDGDEVDSRFGDVQTNGYGQIDFQGATRRAKGKFIKLSTETNPADIFELMTTFWGLEKPRLLISVTGGAKSFNMDSRLKHQFAAGLLKVSQTLGAWVITGGTNTGVMKHVGEALQGATKACIGIATWGIVKNRDALVAERNQQPALGGRFNYKVASSLVETGASLDHNHTQFLLVDDGSEGKYGVEIPFRSKFEHFIVGSISDKVPSVLLVLEGGPDTLGSVCGAIEGNTPVPVVIIKGSGRAADCLAFALDNVTDYEVDDCYENHHKKLMGFIQKTFPELKTKVKRTDAYKKVLDCVKSRDSFTIFQMGGGADVDEAILTALLNSQKMSPSNQLLLTLLWDRADLAEEKILSQPVKWEEKELSYAMIMALAMDCVEFVQLFLSYGVSIKTILTKERLEFLYGYRANTNTSTLRHEFGNSFFVMADMSESNKDVFTKLCSYEGILTSWCAISREAITSVIKTFCASFVRQGNEQFIESLDEGEKLFKYPFRELFFWAVLNNMQEMAMYLWEFEEEGMAKALIGAEINKALAARAQELDLADGFEKALVQNTQAFKNLALQLLDECYCTDELKTGRLITRDSNQFPTQTCLSIAVSSNHLEYVSHSSVQTLLNDVWTGAIKQKDLRSYQVFLGIIFPPYLIKFDFRTKSELKKMARAKDVDESGEDETDYQEEEENQRLGIEETSLTTTSSDLNSSNIQLDGTSKEAPNYGSVSSKSEEKKQKETQLPFYRKWIEFMFKTPVVKFYTNVIAYLAFLCLFAYVTMTKRKSTTPDVAECILIAFIVSLTVEEIHQVLQSETPSIKGKLIDWTANNWNLADAVAITIFYVGLGLRFFESTVHVGHLLYAIDAGLWIMRLLDVFYVHRILGPYVVMIYRMFIDMMYFLMILFVFLLAYGVSTKAILQPTKPSWMMLRDMIFHPYFNIYGELFIDRDPADNATTRFGTPVMNSYAEPIAWVLLGFYLLIANVLLLNLLIAIFNNTFTEVQDNCSQIWKFERYRLIIEYANRPPLVPPFILLAHIFMICKWIYIKCLQNCRDSTENAASIKQLQISLTKEEEEEVIEFEIECMANYIRSKKAPRAGMSEEEKTNDLLEQVEDMITMLDGFDGRLKQIEMQTKAKGNQQ